MFDPYEFFGLSPTTATLTELKTAYYQMALLCHPDKGGDPQTMAKVTLAYQWIRQSLETVNDQQTRFEDVYKKEDLTQPTIPSFTDVLAETFDYTPERFKDLCTLHSITAPELLQMLYVPAFESAMANHATPETLESHLHTFLASYVRDSASATASNVEYYVPMSEPSGYDTNTPWEPEDFQRTALVLYHEPVCLDTATPFAPLNPSSSGNTADFTNTTRPLPMNDYREAFMSYVYPNDIDRVPYVDIKDAYEQRCLERATQDLSLK
jgi:hypothetical protein